MGERAPIARGAAESRPSRDLLEQLDAATGLGDLARTGDCLKALNSRRKGQWGIRASARWRVCFKWPGGSAGPTEVEIEENH